MFRKYQCYSKLFQDQRELSLRYHRLNLERIKSEPSSYQLNHFQYKSHHLKLARHKLKFMSNLKILQENQRMVKLFAKPRRNTPSPAPTPIPKAHRRELTQRQKLHVQNKRILERINLTKSAFMNFRK